MAGYSTPSYLNPVFDGTKHPYEESPCPFRKALVLAQSCHCCRGEPWSSSCSATQLVALATVPPRTLPTAAVRRVFEGPTAAMGSPLWSGTLKLPRNRGRRSSVAGVVPSSNQIASAPHASKRDLCGTVPRLFLGFKRLQQRASRVDKIGGKEQLQKTAIG